MYMSWKLLCIEHFRNCLLYPLERDEQTDQKKRKKEKRKERDEQSSISEKIFGSQYLALIVV